MINNYKKIFTSCLLWLITSISLPLMAGEKIEAKLQKLEPLPTPIISPPSRSRTEVILTEMKYTWNDREISLDSTLGVPIGSHIRLTVKVKVFHPTEIPYGSIRLYAHYDDDLTNSREWEPLTDHLYANLEDNQTYWTTEHKIRLTSAMFRPGRTGRLFASYNYNNSWTEIKSQQKIPVNLNNNIVGFANNNICCDQNILVSQVPDWLRGSTPVGGRGFSYSYDWQKRIKLNGQTNFSNWESINKRSLNLYFPDPISVSNHEHVIQYRRKASTEGGEVLYSRPATISISKDYTMEMERWTTRQGGFWDAQKWMAGDFNGDGLDDLTKVFEENGKANIDVHLSNGSGFRIQRWATQQGGYWDKQKWTVGDFNGDGFDDFAKIFNDNGLTNIDVHLSNGNGSFTMARWATRVGGFADSQKWVAGDFNGDGIDDLAKAHDDQGQTSIDVHISNGTNSFSMRRWVTRGISFHDYHVWIAADFNGNGVSDMAIIYPKNEKISIDVFKSNGVNRFNKENWTTEQGDYWEAQHWRTGDFNGDGAYDLAKSFGDHGRTSIDVHASNGPNQSRGSFTMQRWSTQIGDHWDKQKWVSGDFDGDGLQDMAKSFNDKGLATIDVHLVR